MLKFLYGLSASDLDKEFDNSEYISREIQKNKQNLPEEIFIAPLQEKPFFPGQAVPVMLHHKEWLSAFKQLKKNKQKHIGFLYSNPEKTNHSKTTEIETIDSFYDTGTLIYVHDINTKKMDMQFIAEGIRRFKIEKWINTKPPFRAKISYPEDSLIQDDQKIKARSLAIMNSLKELVKYNPFYAEELNLFLARHNGLEQPEILADFATSITSAKPVDKQKVLEIFDLLKRLDKSLELLAQEIGIAKMQFNIQARLEENNYDQQKQYFLRQQLIEIQKELGVGKEGVDKEIQKYQQKLETLKLNTQATNKIQEEIDRFGVLDNHSPEYSLTRNWLELATSLPWNLSSEDIFDLDKAKKVLDKYHYGLKDIKDRIIEFVALKSFKNQAGGAIICLVGPPGVGKTSIALSIAKVLGRKSFRFSVGGMRDEAEIKGHRKTYIGAMSGKFINALKETQVNNPVIIIDEIDKLASSYQGDPSSALLEVLDPTQNKDFLDNYLDMRFDLSKVLFVCTANTTDSIAEPLLDRMELIHLPGYLIEEKTHIATKYLLPKILNDNKIKKQKINLTKLAMDYLSLYYAREAGVRTLHRLLEKLVRKIAVKLVKEPNLNFKITIDNLEEYLGKKVFDQQEPAKAIGIVNGLAWTSLGGEILEIEVNSIANGDRGFKLTGQLGEVMEESAQIAYSYLCSEASKFGVKKDYFNKRLVHVHVPDGATPKDGPSAGITMATAMLSLAKNRKIKGTWAMTGEISLTGKVLPVGGLREKLVAAKRAKIKNIIVPKKNIKEISEVPEYVKKGLKIHLVEQYPEVFNLVF